MIARIIENHLIPKYLQKNILNMGYIPKETYYQYYYMEIFKGEEGEIILNNLGNSGILIAQIIQKTKRVNELYIINNPNKFPKKRHEKKFLEDNSYLEYNEYAQKISFNYTYTNNCTDGCYLLLTYYNIDFS